MLLNLSLRLFFRPGSLTAQLFSDPNSRASYLNNGQVFIILKKGRKMEENTGKLVEKSGRIRERKR